MQPFIRTNRYDVWQFYGVNRFGQFRPRVIYSPYGSYYLYSGEPFPWVSNHPLEFMPYVSDGGSFYQPTPLWMLGPPQK
jgi:hypothetical protein